MYSIIFFFTFFSIGLLLLVTFQNLGKAVRSELGSRTFVKFTIKLHPKKVKKKPKSRMIRLVS